MTGVEVDLVVPVKSLARAKSRLRGASNGRADDLDAHAELVFALVLDTVTAAVEAAGVRRVLVISPDAMIADAVAAHGIDCTAEGAELGLNEALRHGAHALARHDPTARVAALQADLPALRPSDLSGALAEAGQRRAFCADRQKTGTTLLVSASGRRLDPRFGPGSARAHAETGADALLGAWPSLRCDVDTADDLAAARKLGLGPRTTAQLRLTERGTCHY